MADIEATVTRSDLPPCERCWRCVPGVKKRGTYGGLFDGREHALCFRCHMAILTDYPDLASFQVYACGSAGMVHAAHPAFMAHGMSEHDCFSDAFNLAPHARRATPEADMVRLGGTA